ncbi:16S rRNA (uracil(1498)-N(3))-methyltransferase [Candidatus Peregrinibacteria bacterium]|nr:MAG: 16S rRNA (uracil(1498)-N(3))-methyltransferase [Candidatus Peregrinibacteria bacterium]
MMRQIQHFFLDADLSAPSVHITEKNLLHQMKDVLRFRKGDTCVLLDNRGGKAKAVLEEFHSKEAMFRIEARERVTAPKRALRLYVALSKKPSTFEWIVEKASEMGVTELIPLETERTQVHELRKNDRLLAIMKEAAEQCERNHLPHLHGLLSFKDLLMNFPKGTSLVGDAWDYDGPLAALLPSNAEDVNLFIGPEGGLSSEELSALRAKDARVFLLGETVLRMETAVIAALALVQYR